VKWFGNKTEFWENVSWTVKVKISLRFIFSFNFDNFFQTPIFHR
jgi:hypothetical protein